MDPRRVRCRGRRCFVGSRARDTHAMAMVRSTWQAVRSAARKCLAPRAEAARPPRCPGRPGRQRVGVRRVCGAPKLQAIAESLPSAFGLLLATLPLMAVPLTLVSRGAIGVLGRFQAGFATGFVFLGGAVILAADVFTFATGGPSRRMVWLRLLFGRRVAGSGVAKLAGPAKARGTALSSSLGQDAGHAHLATGGGTGLCAGGAESPGAGDPGRWTVRCAVPELRPPCDAVRADRSQVHSPSADTWAFRSCHVTASPTTAIPCQEVP